MLAAIGRCSQPRLVGLRQSARQALLRPPRPLPAGHLAGTLRWTNRRLYAEDATTVVGSSIPSSSPPTKPAKDLANAAALLTQVAELQISLGEPDAHWVGRVNADFGGHFRITFVGESSAATSEVVGSLLKTGSEVIPENAGKMRTIGYGAQAGAVETDKIRIEVRAPVDWLSRYDVEICEISSFESLSLSQLEDVIYRSDLVVLVTTAQRGLNRVREEAFMERFYRQGKASLVIAVQGLAPHGSDTIRVVEGIREQVQNYARGNTSTLPPVAIVPVDTESLRATSRSEDASDSMESSERSVSGIDDLLLSITSRIDTPDDRAAHKVHAAIFTAEQALNRLLVGQDAADRALEYASENLLSLVDRIVRTEKRLVQDFKQSDLAVIHDSVTALSAAVRAYFAQVKFWKLFWRSEFVADDLKAMMQRHNLLRAEYRMVYAVGKLNEGLYGLYERVQEHVDSLAHPKRDSPLAEGGTPIRALLQDVSHVQQILAHKTSPAPDVSPAGVKIDPFFLRDQMVHFDATPYCAELQASAEKLVRRQLIYQLGLYSSSLLAVHLGVPFAIMAPTAVALSGSGLGWMRLRWGSLETRFWGNVSRAHKTLKENILTVYEKEFTRGVAKPLISVVGLLEEAIETRRGDIARNRKSVEAAINMIPETVTYNNARTGRRDSSRGQTPADDDSDDDQIKTHNSDSDEDSDDGSQDGSVSRDVKRPAASWSVEEQDSVMAFYGLSNMYPRTWAETRDEAATAGAAAGTGASDVPATSDSAEASDSTVPPVSAGSDDVPLDTSDPLGIRDSIINRVGRRRRSYTGGPSTDQLSSLLLSSRTFDPKLFLGQVHKTTSYRDFETGADNLREAIDHKEDVIKNLVKTHFAKFVSAKSTIDSFYEQMKAKNLISSEDYGIAPFDNALDAVHIAATTLYKPLLDRRVQAEKIRSTLAVLSQWKFLFNLPSVLRTCLQKKKYDALVRDYQKGAYIMQSSFGESQRRSTLASKDKDALLPMHHQVVFEKVWNEVLDIVKKTKEKLFQRLGEEWTSLEVQEKYLTYLIDLNAEPDPVYMYLEKQFNWIRERLLLAYSAHARNLNGERFTTDRYNV
ncbi:hypothetical protein HDU86_008374 [Geranomyces michiganensis]|nr:hypothetical protein HDU86_008374 [Geranomyces michiganensis]